MGINKLEFTKNNVMRRLVMKFLDKAPSKGEQAVDVMRNISFVLKVVSMLLTLALFIAVQMGYDE